MEGRDVSTARRCAFTKTMTAERKTSEEARPFWLIPAEHSGLDVAMIAVGQLQGPFANVILAQGVTNQSAPRKVARFLAGEVKAAFYEQREVFREWRLIAGARFTVADRRWQATLSMKCREPPAKGLVRVVQGQHSPFPKSLRPTPFQAMDFAFDFRKRIVTRQVSWHWDEPIN